MTPRLIACYDGALYARFAAVLQATAAQHCPGWDVRLTRLPMVDNQATKLRHWLEAVEAAPDGTPMLLVDADTMILRPLDALWEQTFEVAYTARNPAWSAWAYNAGVCAVRASDRTRAFLRDWRAAELPLLLTKGAERKAYLARYGAVEQAALHQMLRATSLQTVALPCLEWNCEDSSWAHFDPALTRILHIKGAFRGAIQGKAPSENRRRQIRPLLKLWRAWDEQLNPTTVPSRAPRVGKPHQVFSQAIYTDEWQRSRRKYRAPALRCAASTYQILGLPGSLVDVGCGEGALVTDAQRRHIEAVGLDLTLTETDGPLRHANLCDPVDIGRTFDLVLCWEVAEHLPASAAATFCDTLVRHVTPGGILLFTAAPPGQTGHGHINLQPAAYWRDMFVTRGLEPDDTLTGSLGQTWRTQAPETPWYGANLQAFRRPGTAAQFQPETLPSVTLAMRTADRTPHPNYLGGTLRRLERQGCDLADVRVGLTNPDRRWIARECRDLVTTPQYLVPGRPLRPNANALAVLADALTTAADWMVLLEDDLVFCADFVPSLRRWLRDADRSDRHVFRCFGFTVPPKGFTGSAYDWPLVMLRGSQVICLRRDEAADFLAWGRANLLTWCKTTRWRNDSADPQIALDKFVAAWATTRWPGVPGVMSHPYFVKHIGDKSSIHRRGVRNDAPFAGETWRYEASA